tara:strand:- start:23 stop:487 length:465 start_codon:yes stop_codon:yes gene_type:complete
MDLAIFDQFETGLANMEAACNFLPDASDNEGYEASKRVYLDNRKVLKAIDDAHKDAKKPYLDAGRVVDKAKNEIRAKVEAILNPHKLAYQAVDNAQKNKEQTALKASRQADAELDLSAAINKVIASAELSSDLAVYLVAAVRAGNIKNIQFKEQ